MTSSDTSIVITSLGGNAGLKTSAISGPMGTISGTAIVSGTGIQLGGGSSGFYGATTPSPGSGGSSLITSTPVGNYVQAQVPISMYNSALTFAPGVAFSAGAAGGTNSFGGRGGSGATGGVGTITGNHGGAGGYGCGGGGGRKIAGSIGGQGGQGFMYIYVGQ